MTTRHHSSKGDRLLKMDDGRRVHDILVVSCPEPDRTCPRAPGGSVAFDLQDGSLPFLGLAVDVSEIMLRDTVDRLSCAASSI